MLHFRFPKPAPLMGHRLSKIITRTGDGGETGLGDGSRARKDSPRVVALGEIDELNSAIGMLLAEPLPEKLRGAAAQGIHSSGRDARGEPRAPGARGVPQGGAFARRPFASRESRRPGEDLPEPPVRPAVRPRPRPQPRRRPRRRAVAAGEEPLAHASTKASSRFLRTVGATTTASRRPAMRSMVRLIGRWKNTSGSPRDKSIARRRFSAMSGPRMKPRISGAGSHSSFTKM